MIKVKAGALQFTTFIVVVIALLLSGFILFIHTYKKIDVQQQLTKETIDNAKFGIYHSLSNEMPLNDSTKVSIIENTFKTLTVYRDFWGIYEKIVSVSRIKNMDFTQIALAGSSQPENDRTALYIEDHNRPLVLVGKTKIKGTSYVPQQGVRTGNISGHSYYGAELIYGKQKTSKTLPKLQSEWLGGLEQISNKYTHVDAKQYLDLEQNLSHTNSFKAPIQMIYSKFDIDLTNVSLTGHIVVQSKTRIIVDASSNLKDVLLIAPSIQIKDQVKGVFQGIASKEIRVGERCQLNYPSALVLNDYRSGVDVDKSVLNSPTIIIGRGSVLKGVITCLGEIKNYQSQLFIEKDAKVYGEVYCNMNLELLGSVFGSVYASSFVAKQSGSVYQNHIYNGTIIVDELPQEYVGLSFKDSNKGIAKWLY
ncbi:hypothetical protein [uncultured Algibacter sp.]|uniref:hypothetical protein n=1 Tax=uncultured Algibacter sp. TaxID=298659 RepID=UPI00262BE3A3|nr:hypothetical protein [uncultured Algibacter sp.]